MEKGILFEFIEYVVSKYDELEIIDWEPNEMMVRIKVKVKMFDIPKFMVLHENMSIIGMKYLQASYRSDDRTTLYFDFQRKDPW